MNKNIEKIIVWTVINLAICIPLSGFPLYLTAVLIGDSNSNTAFVMFSIIFVCVICATVLVFQFYKMIRKPSYDFNSLQFHFGFLSVAEFALIITSTLLIVAGPKGWSSANTEQTIYFIGISEAVAVCALISLSVALLYLLRNRFLE